MVRFANNDNLYFVGETSVATNIVTLAGAYNKATHAGGTVVQTGSSYTVTPSSNVTYYVSSGTGMCQSPREPVTITLANVNAGTPSVDITSFCTTTNVVLSLAGYNGTIQWQSSTDGGNTWNSITGATTSPYTISNVSTTTSFRAIVSSSDCSATSNVVTTTITSTVPTSVTISGAPTTAICQRTSVTFTANPTNGGTALTFQWRVNGVNVIGATGSTFTTTTLNQGDQVTVFMTSNDPCATTPTAFNTSNAISVTNQLVPNVVLSGMPTTAICKGTSVTFNASPTNGGSARNKDITLYRLDMILN